jgi:hypothetical protein
MRYEVYFTPAKEAVNVEKRWDFECDIYYSYLGGACFARTLSLPGSVFRSLGLIPIQKPNGAKTQ